MPQFGGHTGKPHLLAFGTFVLVRLSFSDLYRREKRVAARRGVHVARQGFAEGNILAVNSDRGVISRATLARPCRS